MVPIRGTVRHNGEPLDHGTVMFIPTSGGRQASAQIQRDGSYELTTLKSGDGAQVGEYKVVIHSHEPHPGEPGRVGHEQNVPAAIKRGHEIPQKYTEINTTPLAVSVTEGHSGVEDFDLSSTK